MKGMACTIMLPALFEAPEASATGALARAGPTGEVPVAPGGRLRELFLLSRQAVSGESTGLRADSIRGDLLR